jgi:hypothetical protein
MRNLVVYVTLFGALGMAGLRLTDPERFNQAVDMSSTLRISRSRPLPSLESLPVSKTLRPAQAYRAIPHRRTQFEFQDADLSVDDTEYLKRIFPLLDQCVVWRVSGQKRLQRRQPNGKTLAEADALLEFAESIDAPRSFRRYHKLLVEALSAERSYFETVRKTPSHQAMTADSNVRRASQALQAAYSEMLRQVGNPPRNEKAVFDYHCAFDFI